MIFLLASLLVPAVTYLLLPRLVDYCNPRGSDRRILLAVAGVLFFVSWYLPSPDIQGEQTAATTHFIGGGIFSGLVWLYIKMRLSWKSARLIELVSLLALVSLLGVFNELFELLVVNIGLANLHLTDTSWDLLMNTMGALVVWALYESYRFLKRV